MKYSKAELEAGFTLGPWRIEPTSNAIFKNSEAKHIENRLMQTLVYLAQNQGQVVSREEFFDSVWEGLVVNEEALSRAISLLRGLLGDSAQSPTFIKTIPGVGYSLIAPVECKQTAEDAIRKGNGSATVKTPGVRKAGWAATALVVLFAAYFAIDSFNFSRKPEPQNQQKTTAARPENSVAVLPFVNMSSDPEQEFFADGVTEEILNLLAGVTNLRVPARTSSFFFKGQDLPVSSIADTLNVKHILEGSVRRSGNRVRITAQLIEASSDKHLWSETYDRNLQDILDLQDEVASAIANSLVDSFEGLEVDPVSRTNSLAAFEAYRTGRLLWWRRSPEDLQKAIELFKQAIKHDPTFAPAYAAIGDSWLLLVLYGKVQIIKGVNNATPMIDRAIELDPESSEANAARGLMLLMTGEKDMAERDLRHAIELDESYIPAQAWLSSLLRDLGRIPEQGAVLQKALAQDPLNIVLISNYAHNLLIRGDAAGAKELITGLLRLQPENPALLQELAGLELDSGNLVEAWRYARDAYELAPKNTMVIQTMAKVWLELDSFAEVEKVLTEGLKHSPGNVNIKLQYLELLNIQARVEEAKRLKDNLFPDDISWLPATMQRTYHYETGIFNLTKKDWHTALHHLELAINPAENRMFDDNQVTTLMFVSLLHKGMGNEELAEQRLLTAERVIGHSRVNGIENAELYYMVACVFAMRGETERALQTLWQAYEKGARALWLVRIDGRLDPLRSESSFAELLNKISNDVKLANKEIEQL